MLSVPASLICLGAIVAIALIWRCAHLLATLSGLRRSELDRKIAELHEVVAQARHESAHLTSLLDQAQQIKPRSAASALADIEALADPAALEDAGSIGRLVAQLPSPRTGLPANLFDDNRQSLAIARLADQGLPAAEISRRLSVPIGEVELRLSMRAA